MFDRKKIIAESLNEAIVGNRYYFSTTLSHLEDVVKEKNQDFCGILKKVDKGLYYMVDGSFGWQYLYPVEEN